ncbi:lytic transglycosylase domain-containing protein [Desulfobacca acetoxidans]
MSLKKLTIFLVISLVVTPAAVVAKITSLPAEKESSPLTTRGEHQRSTPQIPDTPVALEALPLASQISSASQILILDQKSIQRHRETLASRRCRQDTSRPLILEGPIRYHRTKKGVIQISNVLVTSRPTGLAAASTQRLRLREGLAHTLAQPSPPGTGEPQPPMVVQRDLKGPLHIITKKSEPPLLAVLPIPPALDWIAPDLAPIVVEAANAYQLPPSLILSVIWMESNFVPGAVSPKGAMGLMQLMPGTAADLGVQDPFYPRQNIMGGSRYLRHLLNSFDGSLPLAIAAYNAGPRRVAQAGYQVPEIKETKQFVSQVLRLYGLLEKSFKPRLPN